MRYIFYASLILLLAACHQPKPGEEISHIELARSGAWSDYGGAMRIDSLLNYHYYGDIDKTGRKHYSTRISQSFWDSLTRRLHDVNYRTVRDTDLMNVVDVNNYELIVYWGKQKRRIIRQGRGSENEGDTILQVMRWIDKTYRRLPLKPAQSVPFETHFQNPPPMPAGIDTVKFLPPDKK